MALDLFAPSFARNLAVSAVPAVLSTTYCMSIPVQYPVRGRSVVSLPLCFPVCFVIRESIIVSSSHAVRDFLQITCGIVKTVALLSVLPKVKTLKGRYCGESDGIHLVPT